MKLKKLLVKVLAGALLVSAVGAGYISSSAADSWAGVNISFEEGYEVVTNGADADVVHTATGFKLDAWNHASEWGPDIFDEGNHAASVLSEWKSFGIYFNDGGAATQANLIAGEEYELSIDYLGCIGSLRLMETGNAETGYNQAVVGEVLESKAICDGVDITEVPKKGGAAGETVTGIFSDGNGFGETSNKIVSSNDWAKLYVKFKVPVDTNLRLSLQTAGSAWGNTAERTYLDNIILKPAGAPDPAPFEIAPEVTEAPTDELIESGEPTDGGDATAEPTAAATTAAATDAATATQAPTATASDLPTTTATTDPGTTVTKPKSVKLNKKKVTLKVKKSIKLKATLKPKKISAGWTKLTWKSNKPKVAKVNQKGKVTAVKKGTAKITVTTKNKKSAKCTVKVKK